MDDGLIMMGGSATSWMKKETDSQADKIVTGFELL